MWGPRFGRQRFSLGWWGRPGGEACDSPWGDRTEVCQVDRPGTKPESGRRDQIQLERDKRVAMGGAGDVAAIRVACVCAWGSSPESDNRVCLRSAACGPTGSQQLTHIVYSPQQPMSWMPCLCLF